MLQVLITGGTGLIGQALTKYLIEKGYKVVILTRNPLIPGLPRNMVAGRAPAISFANWNISQQKIDRTAVQQSDYIIHLAGAGIADKRWSESRKKEIQFSRTLSSALIVKALQEIPNRVQAVVSASAIGWYGPSKEGSEAFIESDPPDNEFLGVTCRLWEESIDPVIALGIRLVKLRTGIVLSDKGGALPQFKKPIKYGIAAILGNGKQIISWIHMDDLCRIYLEAIRNPNWEGPVNAVAPQPVSNGRLTIELARKLKDNFFIPLQVPPFLLKLIMGELSIEVLKSAKVSSEKLRQYGFQFLYPGIEAAIGNLAK